MKAPEKIYIDVNLDSAWGMTERSHDNKVEYTCTDAFIEKAIEWLKKSITNNPECNRIISLNGTVTMGLLIEDFRNYMKGE